MIALALLLAAAAPAQPQVIAPRVTHKRVVHTRKVRARKPARRTGPQPLLINVVASCSVNPSRIGCKPDPNLQYRLTSLPSDTVPYDGKTRSIDFAAKRNMCGVVGMPVCPRERRPWVKVPLQEPEAE